MPGKGLHVGTFIRSGLKVYECENKVKIKGSESFSSLRIVRFGRKRSKFTLTLFFFLGEGLWSRFNGGKSTLWYYRSLADEFKKVATQGRLRALVQELDQVVTEIEKGALRR